MSWTCLCAAQNLDATRYCEACGAEHTPAKAAHGPSGMAWSPPTPRYTGDPWQGQPRMSPEAVAPYLAELRTVAAARLDGQRPRVTPEQTARYLANLRAKGISTAALEALEPIAEPAPRPIGEPVRRPRRDPAFHRRLALMFPVTEAEERAASHARREETP